MKKLTTILFSLLFAVVLIAQDRTVDLGVLKADFTRSNSITWDYTGGSVDSLTSNQDTIQYVVNLNKFDPVGYYINATLDTIAGAVTLVDVATYGRMFDGQAWTKIDSVAVSTIAAETDIIIESFTDSTSMFQNTLDAHYKQLMLEFKLTTVGNGKGVNIEKIDFLIGKVK